jgi:hypothetical protein
MISNNELRLFTIGLYDKWNINLNKALVDNISPCLPNNWMHGSIDVFNFRLHGDSFSYMFHAVSQKYIHAWSQVVYK